LFGFKSTALRSAEKPPKRQIKLFVMMVVAGVAVFVVAGIVVMAVLVIVAMMMAIFIMRMFMSMLAGAVIMSMV